MYIDDDGIKIYNPPYTYELENEDFPLSCPYYRQMSPFPFLPQGGPQSGPPGGSQGGSQGRPPSSPPNFTPPEPKTQQFGATPLSVDPGAIRPCIFRLVYIWPRRGRGFWAWLTFVGPRSVSGFRWDRNTWRYFGMDLREISSFQCF
jgi:hypothetical protein